MHFPIYSTISLYGTILAAGLVLASAPAFAQDSPLPEGFKSEPLLKSTSTREGKPIAYPAGAPEITAVTAIMEVGGRTPLHKHPVPVFVHVLEGEVELRSENGEPQRYRAGEAYIEALDSNHQLFNVGKETARLLVVFVGAEGEPGSVAAAQQ